MFQEKVPRLRDADLLLVLGTSLKVHPFAALTGLVPAGCPRVLINMERAGDVGARADDVVLLGRCDDVVRDLCAALGWAEELEREWAQTELLVPLDVVAAKDVGAGVDVDAGAGTGADQGVEQGEETTEVQAVELGVEQKADAKDAFLAEAEAVAGEKARALAGEPAVQGSEADAEDARVEDEVEKLADKIGKALEISGSGGGSGEERAETGLPAGLASGGAPSEQPSERAQVQEEKEVAAKEKL